MKVLVLSKDPTMFESGMNAFGDSRKRHLLYAKVLKQRYPHGEIRVITFTRMGKTPAREAAGPGLTLFGTQSLHRFFFLIGVVRSLPGVLAGGWRPDLITVQTPWEEGFLGLLLSKMLGAKFIPQLHFDLFSIHWKRESWLNYWRLWISRRVLAKADGVRVVCTILKEKVAINLGIPRERILVAPVGVSFPDHIAPPGRFSNAPKGTDDGGTVLFVGRFCKAKNLEDWIAVARLVQNEMPKVRFVMAGDGPEMELVRREIGLAGMANRFTLLGSVGHESLPEVYANSNVMLLTSHYEGFGRVILEANLAGIPAVSTACSGPEDLIEDGKTGFLRPCGDVRGLADAVISILKDQPAGREFGRKGGELMRSKYTLERLSSELIDCWEAVHG